MDLSILERLELYFKEKTGRCFASALDPTTNLLTDLYEISKEYQFDYWAVREPLHRIDTVIELINRCLRGIIKLEYATNTLPLPILMITNESNPADQIRIVPNIDNTTFYQIDGEVHLVQFILGQNLQFLHPDFPGLYQRAIKSFQNK